ncbi:hypothetical protein V1512DRAFT_34074 [Lipomyces arxii]|uniref:uncharacterized protein n=1 Tax=Lipomyces arxii TaxID=56418 RepID=UPI0034CF791D
MECIKKLVQGEEAWGQGLVNYDLDLGLEATMMKYHSPYSEARVVCKLTDDLTIPVETSCAYVIGLVWVATGACINRCNIFPPDPLYFRLKLCSSYFRPQTAYCQYIIGMEDQNLKIPAQLELRLVDIQRANHH